MAIGDVDDVLISYTLLAAFFGFGTLPVKDLHCRA